MYLPEPFKVEDPAKLADFIRQNPFGTLFSGLSGNLQASHLPFLFKTAEGKPGLLEAHMAKASLHWQTVGPGEEVLAVFQGPHAYISPNWYGEARKVPTWNYVSIHAYGYYRPIDDPGEVKRLLKELTDFQEEGLKDPWKVESLPPELLDGLADQVRAFRIELTRLEGKWKLGQNHPKETRSRAAEALRRRGGESNGAVADLMERA